MCWDNAWECRPKKSTPIAMMSRSKCWSFGWQELDRKSCSLRAGPNLSSRPREILIQPCLVFSWQKYLYVLLPHRLNDKNKISVKMVKIVNLPNCLTRSFTPKSIGFFLDPGRIDMNENSDLDMGGGILNGTFGGFFFVFCILDGFLVIGTSLLGSIKFSANDEGFFVGVVEIFLLALAIGCLEDLSWFWYAWFGFGPIKWKICETCFKHFSCIYAYIYLMVLAIEIGEMPPSNHSRRPVSKPSTRSLTAIGSRSVLCWRSTPSWFMVIVLRLVSFLHFVAAAKEITKCTSLFPSKHLIEEIATVCLRALLLHITSEIGLTQNKMSSLIAVFCCHNLCCLIMDDKHVIIYGVWTILLLPTCSSM